MKHIVTLVLLGILAADPSMAQVDGERLEETEFGRMPDGTPVRQFTLRNAQGMRVRIISYGAIITEIQAPDRDGNMTNVVAGAETLEPYLGRFPAAAVIGRVVNRIGGARFSIDGHEYRLTVNDHGNHIHGGKKTFARVVWDAEALPDTGAEASVRLTHLSVDGEDGYPGNLTATVTYSLNDDNELRLDYTASTDAPTIVNLSNHAYFDLSGNRDMSMHELWLNADRYTPTDDELIPTGEIRPVAGTPMDFTTPALIGARLDRIEGPVRNAYDCNFVINQGGRDLVLAARVRDITSGRVMEVLTDRPAIQLYTGNPIGFCLETQQYPDAINHPNFPSPIVRPDTPVTSTTLFRLSTQ